MRRDFWIELPSVGAYRLAAPGAMSYLQTSRAVNDSRRKVLSGLEGLLGILGLKVTTEVEVYVTAGTHT